MSKEVQQPVDIYSGLFCEAPALILPVPLRGDTPGACAQASRNGEEEDHGGHTF